MRSRHCPLPSTAILLSSVPRRREGRKDDEKSAKVSAPRDEKARAGTGMGERTVELLGRQIVDARPDFHSDTVSRVGSGVKTEFWTEPRERSESQSRESAEREREEKVDSLVPATRILVDPSFQTKA